MGEECGGVGVGGNKKQSQNFQGGVESPHVNNDGCKYRAAHLIFPLNAVHVSVIWVAAQQMMVVAGLVGSLSIEPHRILV